MPCLFYELRESHVAGYRLAPRFSFQPAPYRLYVGFLGFGERRLACGFGGG